MKNVFEIEKSTTGYTVKIKAGRRQFATAVINGELTLELSKDLASAVSRALYTPKKKPFHKTEPLKTAEERFGNEAPGKELTHREAPVEKATAETHTGRVVAQGSAKKGRAPRKDK